MAIFLFTLMTIVFSIDTDNQSMNYLFYICLGAAFLAGLYLMSLLHSWYQRQRTFHIVTLCLSIPAMLVGLAGTVSIVTSYQQIQAARVAFDASGEDGPPPDFTGLGSLMHIILGFGMIIGLLIGLCLFCSALFALLARKLERGQPPKMPVAAPPA
ncbi:hypothetical protein HW115_06360 [Verrucomicrobiaceae bacterium N1E253]|uniref:Uncharacterized protein n=1 Tax=Oceaniferula marina TaxID=2748318 RepID=A0A851GJ62_9BACT|nr:hypothetical protein [Oceaniferula marina]NWK55225.1 hypothetical protein [Oceaniferula marina]